MAYDSKRQRVTMFGGHNGSFATPIAAGTAVRFEPGQTRSVELVAIAGARVIYGFAGRIQGAL